MAKELKFEIKHIRKILKVVEKYSKGKRNQNFNNM